VQWAGGLDHLGGAQTMLVAARDFIAGQVIATAAGLPVNNGPSVYTVQVGALKRYCVACHVVKRVCTSRFSS
jgi:hypothetical protein